MSIFDSGLPSVRQIQSYIKEKRKVEIGLTTNTTLKGQIIWQDPNCVCLVNNEDNENKTLIWIHSLSYIKPDK